MTDTLYVVEYHDKPSKQWRYQTTHQSKRDAWACAKTVATNYKRVTRVRIVKECQ